ncbi:hypothetical protein [Neobacillus niacini]|uniref:hypothetical protein n=1 Tax=Neobacillus niacini TaxID=86668 RepID=UPI0028653CAB|nr:hypothetical protein [Neobacillus niacini]MDR7001615.1 hypothetical protein [Neobacillus niacini]
MSQFQSGADALNALNAVNEGGGNKAEFASLKSGSSYKVRVLGTADLIRFYSYGIFKRVNSFVAKNPSIKNAKGYPVENYTPWDSAFQYYNDIKRKAQDAGNADKEKEYAELAYQFKAKERYALGFIDLATGEPIIIDLSKKQAQTVHAVIKKNEKKLGKVAFELSKSGSGQQTTVMLSLLFDLDEDLDDKERKNFEAYDAVDGLPKEFDMSLFDGLLYEADDKEMTESLVAAGFDISLIGLSIGASGTDLKEDNFEF